MLEKIGKQLDADIFPRILNGGIVMPNEDAVPATFMGAEEYKDEAGQRTRRPETGSWTGPQRGQGQTRGHGTPSAATSVIDSNLRSQYEGELEAVREAYPRTKVWFQEKHMWLLTESALLPGIWQKAVFLTGIPFSKALTVRSWGFWFGIPMNTPSWIGPRHTNRPDGSICAFEPTDKTWMLGKPIVGLLDLYTLWALRHLHLRTFGKWPGQQVMHDPCERLFEQKPEELCGCGSHSLYADCCMEHDADSGATALDYLERYAMMRKVPDDVSRFIVEQEKLPNFAIY